MMRIELRDQHTRRKIGRIDVDPSLRPTRVTVVDSDPREEVFLNWDVSIDDAGHLRRCVACGCTDLYRERALPQVTGFVVALAFALAVLGATGLAIRIPMLIAMVVVIAIELGILLFAQRRLVCYRCRTTYHGLSIASYHQTWDRSRADRHTATDNADTTRRRLSTLLPVVNRRLTRRSKGQAPATSAPPSSPPPAAAQSTETADA